MGGEVLSVMLNDQMMTMMMRKMLLPLVKARVMRPKTIIRFGAM